MEQFLEDYLDSFYVSKQRRESALIVSSLPSVQKVADVLKKLGYTCLQYSATSPDALNIVRELAENRVSTISVLNLFQKTDKRQVILFDDVNCLRAAAPRVFKQLSKLLHSRSGPSTTIPFVGLSTGLVDKPMLEFASGARVLDLRTRNTSYNNGYLSKADNLLSQQFDLVELLDETSMWDITTIILALYESVASSVKSDEQRKLYIEILDNICASDVVDFRAFRLHQPELALLDKTNCLHTTLLLVRRLSSGNQLPLKFSKTLTRASASKALSTLVKTTANQLGIDCKDVWEKIHNKEGIRGLNKRERLRLERLVGKN